MSACPDPALLEGFLQGSLGAAQRDALELHLDGCSQCAATMAELARVYGTVSASIPATPSAESSTPGQLGRYQLGRRLGQGAMGIVLEAHDPELHRRVAIKLLHPGIGGDVEVTRARMLREARAMAQLAHANVVAVHDVGRVGEQVFVAMELVEGTTLTKWLQAAPRTLAQILAVFVQAGRGLQAAHAVGLVHRDFKPDNVLIGEEPQGIRARVTDFGLARPTIAWPDAIGEGVVAAAEAAGLGATTQGTHGAIVGTPAYMAPEQWRGEPADARSDQFSFCVALYEALFRTRPFQGGDFYALAEQVLRGSPKPPPRSAPAWLRTAILRGLERDPAARHPTMGALLDALARDRGRVARAVGMVAAMAASAAATVAVLGWMSSGTPPSVAVPSVDELAPPTVPASTPAAAPVVAEDCVAKAKSLAGRWDARRRALLVARVDEMHHGEQIAARAMPPLDAWASRWTALATAACTKPSPAVDRCLADALARFDALVQQALELPTFDVDDSLAAAAYRLPRLRTCEQPTWLAALPAEPLPEQRGKVKLLAGDLAAAEALVALDRLTPAPQELARIVGEAQALGYAPLVAEAQLALGRAYAEKYEHDEAVAALEAAATLAQDGVHDRVLADAVILLVQEQGGALLRPEAAARWLRIATAHAERFADPELAARTLVAEGIELTALGELETAVARFDNALPKLRELLGEPHPELARARLALSATAIEIGDPARAQREAELALASLTATLGETDLRTGAAEAALARALIAAGDPAGARTHAELALKVPFPSQSLRHDRDSGMFHGVLGDALTAVGAHDDALAAYRDAKIGLYVGPTSADPLLWEGRSLIAKGDRVAGLVAVRSARGQLESQIGVDDPRLLAMLRANAAAEREAGEIAQARGTLARAIELAEQTLGYGPRTAELQWDLAALEQADGHRERALELFDDAHVPMTSALGLHHPRVAATVLARADLAWELGQKDYAGRLYGAVLGELDVMFGPKDARTVRARARKLDE